MKGGVCASVPRMASVVDILFGGACATWQVEYFSVVEWSEQALLLLILNGFGLCEHGYRWEAGKRGT